MKRPLAFFGFSFLIFTQAAFILPGKLILAIMAILSAACVFMGIFKIIRANFVVLCLISFSLMLSFTYKLCYDTVFVAPVQQLAGSDAFVKARVAGIDYGYGGEFFYLKLQILEINGEKTKAFKIQAITEHEAEIGDIIEADVSFYSIETSAYYPYNASNGNYVGASFKSAIVNKGTSHNLFTLAGTIQYKISENIRSRLPYREGGIAAAISVGDKRFITKDINRNFRLTGISHLLVVSGMHLSILCGLLYTILLRATKKPVVSSISAMLFSFFFMFLTGLTASVIRSAILHIFLYSGNLFKRKSDSLTSLGAAAFLLCIANPYSSRDMGLLLSFTATLGMLLANYIFYSRPLASASAPKEQSRLMKTFDEVKKSVLSSLIVVFTTLPVLIAFDAGVSLLTVPFNLLILPLSAPVIVLGFLGGLPQFPVLEQISGFFAFFNRLFLTFLDRITAYFASIDGIYIHVGGLFAFTVCICLYFLIFVGWKTKRLKTYVFMSAALFVFSVSLHFYLSKDLITISPVGNSANNSVIISSRNKAVIIYRSRIDFNELNEALARLNANECVLFIDMRINPQSTEYVSNIEYSNLVLVSRDIASNALYSPIRDIDISIRRQGGGNIAVINAGGYSAIVPSGGVNLESYGFAHGVFGGSGKLEGINCDTYIYSRNIPDNISADIELSNNATILIRPYKSIIIRKKIF